MIRPEGILQAKLNWVQGGPSLLELPCPVPRPPAPLRLDLDRGLFLFLHPVLAPGAFLLQAKDPLPPNMHLRLLTQLLAYVARLS